jgi:hypothetical protein
MHIAHRARILLCLAFSMNGGHAAIGEGRDVAPPRDPPATLTASNTTETLMPESAAQTIDYSTLSYKGCGHTQDSFSLAVVAAARLLGRDIDYQTVYAYSSNPFAPAIDRGENCGAWWHVNGAQGDRCMGTVAAALGLRATPLDLPPDGITVEDPSDVFERKASAHRKAAAGLVRKEMESGGVMITAGLWKTKTKDGFAPWHWWGIVTSATDDGNLRGACLGAHPKKPTGFQDRPIDFLGSRWVIRSGDVTMDRLHAIRTTLQQAVDRIRGRGRFKAEERFIYGLEAMDAWISQMKTVPFCEACAHAGAKGMAGCAVNNRDTTRSGAAVAASYLRSIAPESPAAVRPSLLEAAEHYDRIGVLLTPATWQAYREMLNDSDKQAAHADGVLVPAKAELSAAADAMEKALAAMSSTATQ